MFDGKKRASVITVEKPFPTDLINGSVRATVGRGTTRVRVTWVFYDIHEPCIPNRVKCRGKIKIKVLITMDQIRYLGISLGGGMFAYFAFSGLGLWVQV